MASSKFLKTSFLKFVILAIVTFYSGFAVSQSNIEFNFASEHGHFIIGHDVNVYPIYEQSIGRVKLTVTPKSTATPHLEYCHDFEKPHHIYIHQSLSGLGVKYYNRHFWQAPFLDSGLLDTYSGYTDRLEFKLTDANTGEPISARIKNVRFKRFQPILFLDNAYIQSADGSIHVNVNKKDIGNNLHLELFPTSFLNEHTVGSWRFDTDIESNEFTITPGKFDAFKVYGLTIEVKDDSDHVPEIISTPNLNASEGKEYSYSVQAFPASNDYQYRLTTFPEGMVVDVNSGEIQWLPSYDQSGSHSVVIEVINQYGRKVNQSFSVEVANTNRAPIVTSDPLKNASENSSYQYQMGVVDPDGDALTFELKEHPEGMQINNMALISWMPTYEQAGEYRVLVQASDGQLNVEQAFTIKVINVNRLPNIDSTSSAEILENSIFTHQFNAVDPDNQVLAYSLAGSPSNMMIDETGVVKWLPNYDQAGVYTFIINVSDGISSVHQEFTLIVVNSNRAPQITSTANITAKENQQYSYTVMATDADGDQLAYELLTSPSGMNIDSSAKIQWTPNHDESGSHSITVRVSDGELSDDQSFVIPVENVNRKPTFVSVPVTQTLEKTEYLYVAKADDADEEAVKYSLLVAPVGMIIDEDSGKISWLPTASDIGSHYILITAVDESSAVTEQGYTLFVENVNEAPVITSMPVTQVNESQSYVYQIMATDEDGDAFSYTLTSKPLGMTISDAGLIEWTSSHDQIGVHKISIKVVDTHGAEANQAYDLNVLEVNDAPIVISNPYLGAIVDLNYQYQIQIKDNENDAISFTALNIPSFLNLTAEGLLQGTPDQTVIGEHTINVQISDGTNLIEHEYVLNVAPLPQVSLPNWGRDFWFVDALYSDSGQSQIKVFITSLTDTQGTIQYTDRSAESFTILANQVLELDSWSLKEYFKRNEKSKRSIHISADADIAVYILNYSPYNTDAMVLMPTDKLGAEYRLSGYQSDAWALGEYAIVATENDTEVLIQPSQQIEKQTKVFSERNEFYSINLNKGEVYSLYSSGQLSNDLTGSKIKADKPIGVYNVHSCQNIPVSDQYCDRLIEQLPSIDQWGSKHALIPAYGRYGDIVRILAKDDNTRILINGIESKKLNDGEFWQFELNDSIWVTSNSPVLVTQFSTSDTYDKDKRELDENHFLTLWEKYGKKQILTDKESYLTNYLIEINQDDVTNSVILVVEDEHRDKITLDGNPLPESMFPNENCGSNCKYAPYNLDYAIGQIALDEGTHVFESDYPFGLYENVHSLALMGDPFMVVVPPVELSYKEYVISTPLNKFLRHFINITIPSDVVNSFTIDDSNKYSTFFNEIGNTGFSYARLAISEGRHKIAADKDFTLFVYGYDAHDSYGFTGGYGYYNDFPSSDLQVNVLNNAPLVGDNICVNAQVIGDDGTPLNDSVINFSLTGVHSNSERIFTDEQGLAEYCFTGFNAGLDELLLISGTQEERRSITWGASSEANLPPVITSTPKTYIETHQVYNYQVTAVDSGQSPIKYRLLESPLDMQIDENLGDITWQPIAGTHRISIEAYNAKGESTQQIFNLIVNTLPVITSYPVSGYNGGSFSSGYNVTDADGDEVTCRFLKAPLLRQHTQFLIGTRSCQISYGDAPKPGVYEFITRISDSKGGFVDHEHTLTVVPTHKPKIINDGEIIEGFNDDTFTFLVDAEDEIGDITSLGLYYHNTKLNGERYPLDNITITQEPMTIEWTPNKDEIGELVVGFGVNHQYGWPGDGTVTFKVVNRDFDVTSTPDTHARVGVPYKYQIKVNDPDNQTLNYQLLSAPGGMQIDHSGLITWTPEFEGLASIKLQVSDGGFIHGQIFDVMVQPQNAKLTTTFIIEKRVLDVGESVKANLSYQNALGGITETLTLDGQALSISDEGVANITLENSGIYTLDYTVKDQFETLTKSITIYAKDASDITAPVANIITPTNENDIYAPTSVVATIEDEQLIYWQLLLRKGNNANDEIIAEGDTQQIVSQAIADIDPTMMINGLYTLTLIAVDLGGNESYDQVNVTINGHLKVGNLSFTTQDLSIPLAGIPITVNRSYDSRRRALESDMGFGWKVEYQDIEIDESMEPTQGWYQFASRSKFDTGGGSVISPSTCIAPLGEKKIVITLPDGNQEKFSASAHALDGGIESISHPGCYFTAGRRYGLAFNALNSTTSKLELGSDINNSFYLTDLSNGHLAADIIDFTFAPISQYKLTTKQGYVYELDQNFGIKTVIDPNGHQLTYTENGIQHSNGKGITFDRDAQGRISGLVDPNGNKVMNYEYDSNGNLRFAKDASALEEGGNGVEYTYTLDHNIIDIIDPLGRPLVKNLYDDDGRLIGQEDANGNIKTFNHNIDERTSIVTDLDGRSTLFNYDEKGNVTQNINVISDSSYDADIVTTYTYDENDNETSKSIGDAEHTWLSTFEGDNQLSATDPEGNTVQYQNYNDKGQEGLIIDELGRETIMEYDTAGNLITINMPVLINTETGVETQYSASNVINARGQITQTTDLRGAVTTYTYYPVGHASAGQKHTESHPDTGTITYTYDANNNIKTETRQRTINGTLIDETVSYEYDKLNRLIKTTYPDTTYSETVYDLAGNVDKERDRFGIWTDFEYDGYGRLIQTDYADGTFEKREYSAEGLLKTVTDISGNVTTYDYDDAGRQWQVTYPDTTTTETRYTPQGWIKSERDARGNLTEYEYDKAGKRTAVIRHMDEQALRHTFTYYKNGELKTETDANGHTTSYGINEFDQRIQTTYHNSTHVGQRYDAMGARTQQVDQNNRITQYGYDDLGRLLSVQAQVQINSQDVPATTYTYDEQGNKHTQTDAEGRTTSWTYDYFGRVLSRTLPEGMSETFNYDDTNRTIIHTDFKGQVTTTVNDVMGRVTSIAYADEKAETFTYWPNGQIKTATVSESGKDDAITSYTYDNRDRLKTETQANGAVLTYDYDANGNRIQVKTTRTTGGEHTTTVDYGYDALNRLTTVTDNSGTTTYTYDKVGNQKTVTYTNGIVTEYIYNDVNQLENLITKNANGDVLSSYTYELDNTGRRESITEEGGRYTDYTYDNLYRLTDEITKQSIDATSVDYRANYQYDWVGNRTYETVDGVSTAYSYDLNDRLISQGGTTYIYDDNGNTLTETLDGVVKTYTWDSKNKLTNVEKSGVQTTYSYNVNGIRNSKTEGGVTTSYLVDSNRDYAQVLEEFENGISTVQYSYGHDLISQERTGIFYFYQYDGLGSTRDLTDSSGAVTDSYDYEAFGEVLNETGTTENNYKFTGEQFDSSLNKYYLRARYYDQDVGRFTQQDIFQGWDEDPTTLHKYLYANADSVNGTDPSGYMTMTEISMVNRISPMTLANSSRAVGQVAVGLIGAGLGLNESFKEFITNNAPSLSQMLENKRANLQSAIKRSTNTGPILYHYTDRVAALSIFGSGTAFVTPPFRGLGTNGNTRPAGFYATDIAPWEVNYTQADLSALFYGGNRNKDVSWFVALDGTLFNPVNGASREYVSYGSQSIGEVSINPVTVGPNLMLP
ncbi:MAG: hypothetical protein JXR16_08080 [Bermanella sp.]